MLEAVYMGRFCNIGSTCLIREGGNYNDTFSGYTCADMNRPGWVGGAITSGCPSIHEIFKGFSLRPLSFLTASSYKHKLNVRADLLMSVIYETKKTFFLNWINLICPCIHLKPGYLWYVRIEYPTDWRHWCTYRSRFYSPCNWLFI